MSLVLAYLLLPALPYELKERRLSVLLLLHLFLGVVLYVHTSGAIKTIEEEE